MSEAIELRDKMEWNRTAAILAMIANVNSDPKKGRTFSPADFNPYLACAKRRNAMVIEVNNEESKALFKAMFTGQKPLTSIEVHNAR